MKVDLATRWLGLKLRTPIVVGSSPLGEKLDTLKRLEEAGAAAVVLPSLYEIELEHDEAEIVHVLDQGTEAFDEATSYLPDIQDFHTGPKDYLDRLTKTKQALGVPVIGSLCGMSKAGWADYARRMQEAGADAIELNGYFVPTDPELDAKAVEDRYVESVATACGAVSIPVAVKIAPYFTAPVHFARRLQKAGAKGLTLFQRVLDPDIDLEELHVGVDTHLSGSDELGNTLRWLAILHGRVGCDLAASTGAHKAADVLKLLLAGACSVQMASALIKNGPEHVTSVLKGVELWLEEHEDPQVAEVEGSLSQLHCEEPQEYEHAQHHKKLIRYTHHGE